MRNGVIIYGRSWESDRYQIHIAMELLEEGLGEPEELMVR